MRLLGLVTLSIFLFLAGLVEPDGLVLGVLSLCIFLRGGDTTVSRGRLTLLGLGRFTAVTTLVLGTMS